MANDNWIHTKHRLEIQIKENPCKSECPSQLALGDVLEAPEVFQHRSGNMAASRKHVEELTRSLRNNAGKPFAPVTVFWIGIGWCCIDGHHRLAAYKASKHLEDVPVVVFNGSVDQAIGEALRGNSRDKLPMGRNEKIQAAWRLVTGTRLVKEAIVKASGASDGTVAHQRRVKTKLADSRPELHLGELRWVDALKLYQGLEITPRDFDEEWLEKEAQELANRITKHFGVRLGANSEVTARALEIYNQPLVEALADYWRGYGDDLPQIHGQPRKMGDSLDDDDCDF